jgi:hypothetical protein
MRQKTYSRRELPPCPDPDICITVKTGEGYYWRKKRGSVKKASLNAVFAHNPVTSKITGPVASLILRKLEPFTGGLLMGRMTLKIAGLLMKIYDARGVIDFSMLSGLEFNAVHPLEKLLHTEYAVTHNKHQTVIRMQAANVQEQNNLVSDYFFDAVLLYGDPLNDTMLTIIAENSPLFSIDRKTPYDVELAIPATPDGLVWMLLLKLSCFEGKELAAHPKHYGMKVVRNSSD